MSSQNVTAVLNSVLDGTSVVIPMELAPESPRLVTSPFEQEDMGVLIGMTGDLHGRLILEVNQCLVGAIAEKMYGMSLSGDMLESFTGELGNMIAGNMATKLSERHVALDITPPTVLIGHTKIAGFKKGIQVPVAVEDKGKLNFVLIFEE